MKLSILIPTYNDDCYELVKNLQVQAVECLNDDFEIIVADDGSTDEIVKLSNLRIEKIPRSRIIFRDENIGRARIRNFLVCEAKGEYIIFIDGDLTVIRNDYIKKYLSLCKKNTVVYGGYEVGGDAKKLAGNLRYRYEISCKKHHTYEKRLQKPYADFHTGNFLAPREVMVSVPFDERFKHYGYEDVFLGKQLKENAVLVTHSENPLGFEKFESNAEYLRKTDECAQTLVQFKEILRDYSTLLKIAIIINTMRCGIIMKLSYKLFYKPLKKNLLGNNPDIFLFVIYKILKINEIY